MESRADRNFALLLTLIFHIGVISLAWISTHWHSSERDAATDGVPLQATLMVSTADIQRAQQAIQASTPAPTQAISQSANTPQPLPEPNPQTSDTPLQVLPQEALDQPDTVDQERIDRLGQEKSEREAQEQEQRQRQEQIELETAHQQAAERRQRLREQMEAIQRERDAAKKRTHLEEQRLRQLTDLQAAKVRNTAVTAVNGNHGTNQGAQGKATNADLRARYTAALNAAVRANWNTAQAPERVYCKVTFTQIPGGDVINVEFTDCPYDAQGRESIERALHKNPLPYSGFESVFERKPTLTLCHPDEFCQ